MKIYIDFDDVLCETAKNFTKIAKELFGKDVPYSEVQFFNLKKTFDLNDEQYEELMRVGHLPEQLLNYEETPGASQLLISGSMKDMRCSSSQADPLIPTNHREGGLMSMGLRGFCCIALTSMDVKSSNRPIRSI